MNFDKEQKQIWEASKNFKISSVPNKNDVWERLIQQMDLITKEDVVKNTPKLLITWPKFDFLSKKFFAFTFLVIFSLPISYHYWNIQTITTQIGQQEKLILPDQSLITLNYESKIIYSKNYNIKNRSINLVGEAYFEIKKNNLPFIIDTQYGEIEVVGTSFNVRTRKDGFEVGVNEGKVKVINNNFSIELSQGQLLSVNGESEENISKISYPDYPDWINNKFYYKNTTLAELCSEIERAFNINIQFSSPHLKEITVTGVIDAYDFNSVLRTVSLLTQHEFKLEGGIYTIF